MGVFPKSEPSLTKRDYRYSGLFYRETMDGPVVEATEPCPGDVFHEFIEVHFKRAGSEELSSDGIETEYQGRTGRTYTFVKQEDWDDFKVDARRVEYRPADGRNSTLFEDGTLIVTRPDDFKVFVLKRNPY